VALADIARVGEPPDLADCNWAEFVMVYTALSPLVKRALGAHCINHEFRTKIEALRNLGFFGA
jgi:hypothetical protein